MDSAIALPLHGLLGVLDQVMDDLTQAQWVAEDLHPRGPQGHFEADLAAGAAIEVQDLAHQAVEHQSLGLHLGGASIVGEVVDHGLHGLDLLDYGTGGAVEEP